MNPILLSETEHNGRTQICLLHMDEVAKRLGVSLQRAYELGRQGLLPIVRLGRQMRVEEHRLVEWIAAGGATRPVEDEQFGRKR